MYVKNERFNFGLYFICQLVSNLGSSMQVSIIPLVILDMTGSGSTMGFFLVQYFLLLYSPPSIQEVLLIEKIKKIS